MAEIVVGALEKREKMQIEPLVNIQHDERQRASRGASRFVLVHSTAIVSKSVIVANYSDTLWMNFIHIMWQ